MKIELTYNDGQVLAIDENGNELHFALKGKLLTVLFAEFKGVIYDKTEFGWKRKKRGAVSADFYNWFESIYQSSYTKHFK